MIEGDMTDGRIAEEASAAVAEVSAPGASEETKPSPRQGQGRRVRCPACGGHGEPEGDDTQVCRCGGCRTLFLNPRPSAGELLEARNARFKGALRLNHGHEIREQLEAAVNAMRGYHHLVSGKDAALNAFGKKVLDLGCGLGFRMRECIHYGWTAQGLEPSANARAYTGALMLEVSEGDFGAPPPGPFDLVLMEDLIDEVPEPGRVAAAVRKVLAPRGVLCVSVRETGEDVGIPEGKLCRFDAESLQRLFMPLGLAAPRVASEDGVIRLWFPAKGNP